jgi:hypothetical protein
MVKNMSTFIIFLICLACGPPLLITPRQSLNTILRLDGYYVSQSNGRGGYRRYSPLFLYKNGIVLEAYSGSSASDSAAQAFLREHYADKKKLDKIETSQWGIVSVSGSTISIEMRNASLEKAEKTLIEKGTILNNTTFELTVLYDRNGKKIDTYTDVYKFKKFSPKPDSTNKYKK